MPHYRTSHSKRLIGLIIGILPFVLSGLSIFQNIESKVSNTSLIFGALGILITILNFWYFVRPYFWMKRYGNMSGYINKSQIPLIGTIFGLLCVGIGFGSIASSIIALIIFALDTGGIPWFIFSTWSDESFWGNEK